MASNDRYRNRVAKDDSIEAMRRAGVPESEIERMSQLPAVDEKTQQIADDLVKIVQAAFIAYSAKFKYRDVDHEMKEMSVKSCGIGPGEMAIELIRAYGLRNRNLGGQDQ